MAWIRCILFLLGAAAAGSPSLYLNLGSLYGTAVDHRHAEDWGAAWEQPAAMGFSLVFRFRHLKVRQDEWTGYETEGDNIYANTFPAAYRMLGFQTALRRHPWDWMPGFFLEAVAGYKRITGGYAGPAPAHIPIFERQERLYTPASARVLTSPIHSPHMLSFENHAFETMAGFGYLWEWKRLRCALGFGFGPELLFRNSVYDNGTRTSSNEVLDLLRFNALELGVVF